MKLSAYLFILLSIITFYNYGQNYNEVKQQLKDSAINYVMFSFCDILGDFKELTMPIDEALNTLKNGAAFDGSSVLGYSTIITSDLILKPDLATLRIIPWAPEKHKTAWFICDIYTQDNQPLSSDPRIILKKTIKEALDKGYHFNVGPELEFFLIKNHDNNSLNNNLNNNNASNKSCYFNSVDTIKEYQEKIELLNILEQLNIPVEKIHREVASDQYEVSIHYGNALEKADQIIAAKYALKLMAPTYNMQATFMPKPYKNKSGSGMHIHYSLIDCTTQANIFYDKYKPHNLSRIAHSFIAGNLKYIYDFSALFNPSINSYKRLVPGYEAPIYIAYGVANRSTLIRIPAITCKPELAMRVEIRCPDPLCNPYLAFASLLHTGLQGIKENLPEVPQVTENIYKLTYEEIQEKNIKSLPQSLNQALTALIKSDQVYKFLGKDAHKAYTVIKQKECHDYNTSITDWERQHYL